ncbi:MAG: hypothetical protein ACM32O_12180 [Clostridia bacterium]
MDAKVVNTYLKGLTSVMGPLGMEIERTNIDVNELPYADPQARIVSQLSGEAEGDIIISMAEETFMKLLESFSIPPEMVDDSMKQSILTEFGDMVRGHAITGFQTSGLPIQFQKVDLVSNVYPPESDSLPQRKSLCVSMIANNQYPLHIHFVLDHLYRK